METQKTLRKLLNEVKPLVETTDTLKKLICRHGIVTGSSAFGCLTYESDVNIIISGSTISFETIMQDHNGICLNYGDFQEGLKSAYVLIDNVVYNLLIFHDFICQSRWVFATDTILYGMSSDPYFKDRIKNNKNFRIKYFETLLKCC